MRGVEYTEAALFTVVGIAGVLVLAWIGWQQTRIRTTRKELTREKGLREWLSHEPVRRTGRLDPLAELRVLAVDAQRESEMFEKFAEEAAEQGDPELAGFFTDAAAQEAEIADEAVELLRDRLPDERPPSLGG